MNIFLKKIAFLLFIPLLAAGCKSSAENPPAVIAFTGDIMMHIPVKNCAARNMERCEQTGKVLNNGGFDILFDRISGEFRDCDVVQGNMEFPVKHPFSSRPMIFNSRPEIIPAMQKAGFTMVTIANNHLLDQGVTGARSTMKFLKEYGLEFIGAGTDEVSARSGIIKNVNGIRIGFLSNTGVMNFFAPKKTKDFHLNMFYNREDVFEDIDLMKGKCDYLVMTGHFGAEYIPSPADKDREIIKSYMERGVDLFVGHHPHILLPIERMVFPDGRKVHIFYSLGNFISNQSSSHRLKSGTMLSTRDSVILKTNLKRSESGINASFTLVPIMTENKVSKKGGRHIQTTTIESEITESVELGKNGSTEEKAASQKRIDFLNSKLRSISEVLEADGIEEIKIEAPASL